MGNRIKHKASHTPGKFQRSEDDPCHPHVVPAACTSTDPEVRTRAYHQRADAAHKRWAKNKARRIARKRQRQKDYGFTLMELVVGVVIVAILLAIAIPTFIGARERAQVGGKNTGNDVIMRQRDYTDYLVDEQGHEWRFTVYRNVKVQGQNCDVIKTDDGVSVVCPNTPR